MLEYIAKRLLQVIPVLLIVSVLVVCLTRLVPGDPIKNLLGEEVTKEQYDELAHKWGLDEPVPVQYVNYIKGLLQGDLGRTIYKNHSVSEELNVRFPKTFKVAVWSVLVSAVIGILFGVISALNRGKFWDSFIMVLSLIALSTPIFFLAIVLMVVFGVELKWLPIMGLSSWKHYILPVLSLAFQSIATITRTMRSTMLDVLNEDYIRTAYAMGIPRRVVIFKNAIRNAIIPVITVIGLQFGGLLTGAVITESVFSISGMGSFMIEGVTLRDYPIIQGTVIIFALIFVVVNLLTDLLYGLFDPRVSYK